MGGAAVGVTSPPEKEWGSRVIRDLIESEVLMTPVVTVDACTSTPARIVRVLSAIVLLGVAFFVWDKARIKRRWVT